MARVYPNSILYILYISFFHGKLLTDFVNKMNFLIIILTLISFIAFKIYRNRRVPEGIKNVPELSYLNTLIHIFLNKAGPDKRWENSREILEKEGIVRVIFLDIIVVYSFFFFF